MFLQFCLKILEAKFFACRIRYLEQSVRVKREDVSSPRLNLANDKFRGRKNAQRHVLAFQSCYFAGLGGKVQNGRMACKSDPKSVSTLREETKCDEHVRFLQWVEDFDQAREKAPGVIAGAQQHARRALDHAHDHSGRNAVARYIRHIGDPMIFRSGKID